MFEDVAWVVADLEDPVAHDRDNPDYWDADEGAIFGRSITSLGGSELLIAQFLGGRE